MSVQLLHLPVEILRAVGDELEEHELRSLRLVCQHLDQVAFSIVGPRHFADVRVESNRKGLQRIYDLSQSVRVGPCVKRLEINWGCRCYEKWTHTRRTNKILQKMRRAARGLKLESLEFGFVPLTLDMLRVIMLSSRDSLHTLKIQGANMEKGDQWHSVFADMVGKFPRLRTVLLDHLRKDHSVNVLENDVDFPRLARNPAVPGWKKDLINEWGTGVDIRQLDGLQNPVQIHHRPTYTSESSRAMIQPEVKYVTYSGPDMDQFLLLLAEPPKAS